MNHAPELDALAGMSGVAESIRSVVGSESALVIRNAIDTGDERFWIDLLRKECGLHHDRRHFDVSSQMVESDWWEISNQSDLAGTYAHSRTAQPFHTDNAWFSDGAELNFFLMIRQARSGGEQWIYPVSKIVKDLEAEKPKLLEKLASMTVAISKGDATPPHHTTIIDLQKHMIFWNYYRTDKTTPGIRELCDEFFDFLRPDQGGWRGVAVRLGSGDGLCFDDRKVLHARTGFEAEQDRERVLLQSMWASSDRSSGMRLD